MKEFDIATALANLKFKSNATYPSGMDSDFAELDLVRAVHFGLATGRPVMIKGDPGTGKTSFAKWLPSQIGIEVVYIPAATKTVDDMAASLPLKMDGKLVLDTVLFKQLTSPNPKILLFDELSRSTKSMLNQCLEIVWEKTIDGVPIPNVVGVIACDNEGAENGITLKADFAQASRWVTVKISPNSSPWRPALAEKVPGVDLKPVFKVYDRLSPRLRYLLSPRTLEHVIYNVLAGNPPIWGLPLHSGTRAYLVETDGTDKTVEVLSNISAALGVPYRETVGDPAIRAIKSAIRDEVNVIIEGAPGIGKTAVVKQIAQESGHRVIYMSIPVANADALAMPVPIDGELDVMIRKSLAEPGRKIIIFDEVWRGSAATRSKIMEMLQERSIGGVPIDDLVCIIALNNPKEIAGFKLDVGRPDRAQADRFFMSVQVAPEDIPAYPFLLDKYGDEAKPFVEWHKFDLDDLGRVLITKRQIEMLIELHRMDLPLDWAKPYMDGHYVDVSFHDLVQRLADMPPARLDKIVMEADEYEARLAAGGPQTPTDHRAHAEVHDAFAHAEIKELEASYPVVVRLLGLLQANHRIALVRPAGPKQPFWCKALPEAMAEALKAQ